MPPKSNNYKKAKLYESRTIRTELSDSAFIDNEKLSLPDFLNSRSFEIKSLELSQLKSKYALSKRVFQKLPRVLRRRAASHNVKRVPKRIRNRAIKEMSKLIQQTPIDKKTSKRALYKLKMVKNLLKLGSRLKLLRQFPEANVYNRNINTRNRINLINEQIKKIEDKPKPKFNNYLGSHDNTGINEFASKPKGNLKYFKRQIEYVWIPTHMWHAKRFHMIKTHGYQIPLKPTQKCYRLMNRQRKLSSIVFDTSYNSTLILQVSDESRLHDIALSLMKFRKKVPENYINGIKSYDDVIYVDGNFVGKGLIYINNKLKKMLIRVYPSIYEELFTYLKSKINLPQEKIYDCRYSLASLEITGPNSINALGKVFHEFYDDNQISDLWKSLTEYNEAIIPQGTTFSFEIKDPRFWKNPTKPKIKKVENMNDVIISLSTISKINLESLEKLFDNEGRESSYANQLSIKMINREFSMIKPTSNAIASNDRNRIPIFITKLSSGNWTVLLPWYWMVPLWSQLMKVKYLQTGGLNQLKQFNFERGKPNFPNDYQFLRDGWIYNKVLGEINSKKYNELPKSKQVDFQRIESIISPFNCDWVFLKMLVFGLHLYKDLKLNVNFADYDENLERKICSVHDLLQTISARREIENSQIPIQLFDRHLEFHAEFENDKYNLTNFNSLPQLPVKQCSIDVLQEGKVKDNARIYKFPQNISVDEYLKSEKKPEITDLIGFVTSGTFNLNKGHDTGIGLIAANFKGDHVLIRNVGCTNFYLCRRHIT